MDDTACRRRPHGRADLRNAGTAGLTGGVEHVQVPVGRADVHAAFTDQRRRPDLSARRRGPQRSADSRCTTATRVACRIERVQLRIATADEHAAIRYGRSGRERWRRQTDRYRRGPQRGATLRVQRARAFAAVGVVDSEHPERLRDIHTVVRDNGRRGRSSAFRVRDPHGSEVRDVRQRERRLALSASGARGAAPERSYGDKCEEESPPPTTDHGYASPALRRDTVKSPERPRATSATRDPGPSSHSGSRGTA